MRGESLKHLAATSLAKIEPTEAELRNALADGIDCFLHAVSMFERATIALERLASCVDSGGGASPPTFAIHQD